MSLGITIRFMSLTGDVADHTDSFREDLVRCRLTCRTIAARWAEEMSILEGNIYKVEASAEIISVRMRLALKMVDEGMSFHDLADSIEMLREHSKRLEASPTETLVDIDNFL